jgi:hypothetical protein
MPPKPSPQKQILAKLSDIQKTLAELAAKLERIENNQLPPP